MTEIERAAKVVGYLTWDREIDGAPAFESAALDWLAEHLPEEFNGIGVEWDRRSREWKVYSREIWSTHDIHVKGGKYASHKSRASALARAVLAVSKQEKAKCK